MTFKYFIFPAVIMFQVAGAQNGSSSLTITPAKTATAGSVSGASTVGTPTDSSTPTTDIAGSTQTAFVDYKSVYEAATLEEEVKMAAERFNLSASQQDLWTVAATDRRETEKQARFKLEAKTIDNKDAVYRGLRAAQNSFYEKIVGYLNPTQKQALETDRIILEEKRKKIAKLPPPVIAPTVTVVPVDSAAIKASNKAKAKKSKKKKKTVGA